MGDVCVAVATGGDTAIDGEDDAGDPVGIGEVEGGVGDVVGGAVSAEGLVVVEVLKLLVGELAVEVGGDDAGGDGIDADVVGGEFDGEIPGQRGDTTLGGHGGAGGEGGDAVVGEDGTDVDDGAVAMGSHVADGGLGEQVGAAEVTEVGVEFMGGVVGEGFGCEGAGVVDEKVESAEAIDGVLDQLVGCLIAGDIGRGDGDSVGVGEPVGGAAEFGFGSAVEDDAVASGDECVGDGEADAAAGTGDQSGAGVGLGRHLELLVWGRRSGVACGCHHALIINRQVCMSRFCCGIGQIFFV